VSPLDLSPKLLAEAERGQVREEDFVDTVRTSPPYAYDLIAGLAGELRPAAPFRAADP
jgi:hypothetical protein